MQDFRVANHGHRVPDSTQEAAGNDFPDDHINHLFDLFEEDDDPAADDSVNDVFYEVHGGDGGGNDFAMARNKDHRDPREFICRAEAPTFDMESSDWDLHQVKWRIFLQKAGINLLYNADPADPPNADVTRAMQAEKRVITANAFMSGLSESSLRVVIAAVAEAERDNVAHLIKALDDHIRGGTNTAVYRRDLAHMVRPQDLKFDDWVVQLRDMGQRCGYKEVAAAANLEDHLKDVIMANVNDEQVVEKLLRLPNDASLADVLKETRACFASRFNAAKLSNGGEAHRLYTRAAEMVKTKSNHPKKLVTGVGGGRRCGKCGYDEHDIGKVCPAEAKDCDGCKRRGHFRRCCPERRTQTPQTRRTEVDDDEDPTLHSALLLSMEGPVMATALIGADAVPLEMLQKLSTVGVDLECTKAPEFQAKSVPFLADWGANVTGIPLGMLDRMGLTSERLSNKKRGIRPPELANGSKQGMTCMGTFRATLKVDEARAEVDMYVYKGLSQPILSRQACGRLGILHQTRGGGDVMASVRTLKINKPNFTYARSSAVVPEGEREMAMRRLLDKFPRLVDGVCRVMKGGPVTIKLRLDAHPEQVYTTRVIPAFRQAAFQRELEELKAAGIIRRADDRNDPSEWLHPMTVVAKADPSKVRITVDLRALNRATIRPVFTVPPPMSVVASIPPAARYFTVIDGLKGFHQLELAEESQPLTTFVTPEGRYVFQRLPMGWCGSSDVFNERMEMALAGVPNIRRVVEDVLIYSETWAEHEKTVEAVWSACDRQGISLNVGKIQFARPEVKFGGFIVSQGRYRVDPALTEDLREFPVPHNRSTLKSFLGLAQQLGNFTSKLTTMMEPLRELNSTRVTWHWLPQHQQAFEAARTMLSSPEYLTFFDRRRPTELHTDASKLHGLGFVLRQKCDQDGEDGEWRTVQCGSRTLAKHEQNWNGSCEVEALAVAWAAKKCSYFLDGHPGFVIVTDSKPLEAVLNNCRLYQIQNDRLLKLRMILLRFSFVARHQKGSLHVAPDAFSRAPVKTPKTEDLVLSEEEEAEHAHVVRAEVAAALAAVVGVEQQDAQLEAIRKMGARDAGYAAAKMFTERGWPSSSAEAVQEQEEVAPFFKHRERFRVVDDLLLHGSRLVVPAAMVKDTLDRIHAAHQGETKTLERARRAVWWPTLTNDVVQRVRRCRPCQEHRPGNMHETLQGGPEANRPFQKVHMDLFQEAGANYLVMTDEFSGYPVLFPMGRDTTAAAIIGRLRDYFVQAGVPTVLHPDNGRQLVAGSVRAFVEAWGVALQPSSPRLPQSNGRAEAAVKAMKRIVRGATSFGQSHPDPDKVAAGILAFRNTRRYGGQSPSEMVFGHWSKEMLPVHRESLQDPRWAADPEELDQRAEVTRETAAARYNEHSRDLDPFPVGTPVSVEEVDPLGKRTFRRAGVVVAIHPKKMYDIKQVKGGILQRNRVQLRRRYVEGWTSGAVPAAAETERPRTPPPVPPQPPAPTPAQGPQEPLGALPSRARAPAALPARAPSTRIRRPNPWVSGPDWAPR